MFRQSEILKLTVLIWVILRGDNAKDVEGTLFIDVKQVRQLLEVFGVHFYVVEIPLGEVI